MSTTLWIILGVVALIAVLVAVVWQGTPLVAVLLLGPALLWPGTVLRGDMVFVPHQPWKDSWLALDGSAPRFVPGDSLRQRMMSSRNG